MDYKIAFEGNQKIKREIAKIISSSGDLHGAEWKELKKIDRLVELFKAYARSLVPKNIKVRKLSEENAYDYAHRVFQETREEILRRIEEGTK